MSARRIIATLAGAVALAVAPAAAHAQAVRPIDWSRFHAGHPADPSADVARRVLLNADRYAMTTWFDATFGEQDREPYLSFGGNGENQIRPPACEALALAATLKLGLYDAAIVGRPRAEAQRVALRLIASLAHRHLANTAGGWGNHWQSALWASWAGMAGWLMWDQLAPADRERIRRMVEHEADRFLGYAVPYYRDTDGRVVSPGDTKAEENAWNSAILSVATAMMPDHPDRARWMDKNLELMLSAFARPSDVDRDEHVNGKRLRLWLEGSNLDEEGTLVNHGILHPDYMTTTALSVNGALAYALAGEAAPEAAAFNADAVYRALVDLECPSPPFDAPGGTMYIEGSGDIYYPMGTDWGRFRAMDFALVDVQADLFGLDHAASKPAARWEELHMARQLRLQSRFEDGRTYGDWSEHEYFGREQFVAVQAAQIYLFKWLAHQNALRLTDRAYPLPPGERADGAAMKVELADRFVPGEPALASVTVRNDGEASLSDLELGLDLPPGWSAEPVGATPGAVRPGGEETLHLQIQPPATGIPGTLGLRLRYVVRGAQRTLEASRAVRLWAAAEDLVALVGEVDESSGGFALAPAGYASFPSRFPAGVDFTAGADDPAAGWSYIHPGPRDRWAGSRDHRFAFRFELAGAPRQDLAFTAWLIDTNHLVPPVASVSLNDGPGQVVQLPAGGGDGYHWGDGRPNVESGVNPTSFDVRLPVDALRAGENVVTITRPSGAWMVYDAVGVRRLG